MHAPLFLHFSKARSHPQFRSLVCSLATMLFDPFKTYLMCIHYFWNAPSIRRIYGIAHRNMFVQLKNELPSSYLGLS